MPLKFEVLSEVVQKKRKLPGARAPEIEQAAAWMVRCGIANYPMGFRVIVEPLNPADEDT